MGEDGALVCRHISGLETTPRALSRLSHEMLHSVQSGQNIQDSGLELGMTVGHVG